MTKTLSYQIGDTIGHFKVTKAIEIKELRSILYELEHRCGAKIMQIANDDKENLFSLNFQTLPSSDNGVPHILEHTVLCGSKKYPIKDPFFGMIRRSLNTFMNAMTGPDFTCYPAASQVENDFYNLLDVYLDAVFNPILNRLSFLQEGHRLEFEKKDDPSSNLLYKGIVYNEMKGSLSAPDTRIWHATNKKLMPDLPYCHNSGGDPKEIPNLSYEEFVEFHKTYYHPSRCLFYFYGNLPLEQHLKFIEERILKDAEKLPPLPAIPLQKRFAEKKHVVTSYATQDEDVSNKTFVGFAWLTAPVKDQEDILALCLLDSILMDTDASPLKHALLTSGLTRGADAFIDVEMSETPYFILCRGTEEKSADKIEKLIFDTLKQLAKDGIDKKLIDSALHQLEFSRSEITGDYQPFGLSLFFRAALPRMHGCPAENALVIHSLFEKLLKLTSDPKYLSGILHKYFIDNTHFVRCIMKPDLHLTEEDNKQEEETLKALKKALKKEEADKIIKDTHDLEAFQKAHEHDSADCLPKIALCDVPKENVYFPLEKRDNKNFILYYHNCFTNHIVYVDCIYSLPKLSLEELQYTRLFIYLFGELGSGKKSYTENLELMHAHTGDIGASLGTHVQCRDPDMIKPAIHVRGKALSRNIKELFSLIKEMLEETRFDEKERIKELMLQLVTSMQNRLNSSAMSYATDLAMCNNSNATKLHHIWYGLNYFNFIKDLAENIDKKLPEIQKNLENLAPKLFHGNHFDVVFSGSTEDLQVLENNHFFGLDDMQKNPYSDWVSDFSLAVIPSHARVIATQVAFTVKGFKTVAQPDTDAPYLSIASTIMENKVLHKKIREVGGAYGSGAQYNSISGSFYMHAYRDPHITSSLKAFDDAIEELKLSQFSDQDVEEAKLSIIQGMDTPVSPGSRATITYSQMRDNRTKEIRQAYRDALLAADCKQIQNAVEKHLLDFSKKATTVTFCEKALIEKENVTLADKLPVYTVTHSF
ncbi:metalloprotease [Candidatus Aerophobetes bacterium]|uniref:Metalloprotease n=1 Tax=Aerophobetes bacterium TaxID=2030807 RepID=A0A2A4YM58_UNCAE|nr:MAG: metalloprotease [Candidatus Aerophobetes bacterium]